MGTETDYYKIDKELEFQRSVKLNNPLMGTETRWHIHLHRTQLPIALN